MEDFQAWQKYPHMRPWFSKLYVAELFGYDCGPGGIPPTRSGWYCVRPIYNIGGMGVGARKQWICAGNPHGVEPGYFWCEWFEGDQYSTTYKANSLYQYEQISCYKADRGDDLYKFKRWTKTDIKIGLDEYVETILIAGSINICNVETIGNKIVEIHFRDTPDPDYNEIIPIWKDGSNMIDIYKKMGYIWIEAHDDSNGHLSNYRLGFMVK